jgi:hypothetical protein
VNLSTQMDSVAGPVILNNKFNVEPDDVDSKKYHVKSYHINTCLKTLDEQTLTDFHRHIQHIENFTDSFLYEFFQ